METVNKDEFLSKKHFMITKLRQAIYVYPTDTIYGIGCNAEETDQVSKIRELKQRADMPFSVIAPSKEWIKDNCEVDEKAKGWIDKLPGPYTLILKLKNKNAVASTVNIGKSTLGIRIPDNWFSMMVAQAGVPVVTTSANVAGRDFMTCPEDLDPDIKKGVDYLIDDGTINGKPSTLVFLDKELVDLKER